MQVRLRIEDVIFSQPQELCQVVRDQIENAGGEGELEEMRAQIDNMLYTFGRLVQILVEKKVITLSDVTTVLAVQDMEIVEAGQKFVGEKPGTKNKVDEDELDE